MGQEFSFEVREQHDYYERTAESYDAMHVDPGDEHGKALNTFIGLAEAIGPVNSVLDVGAGTGRALMKLKDRWPNTRLLGIEPVEALRRVGHKNSLPTDELISGDALKLDFEDNYFDYVIATGVLHHIPSPREAVREMTRVAKKGIMISDTNNIGQGNFLARTAKYLIKRAGLWRFFIWVQTGGKMFKTSDGDGVYYSFSVYDCVDIIRQKFPLIYYMNTVSCDGVNIQRNASHVMVFATNEHRAPCETSTVRA